MTTRRAFIQSATAMAASLALSDIETGTAQGAGGAARPNVVLILADDMGYSDIGCYGSEIGTPNLDGLATGGLRFSTFYNNPRCCPSRASLLTGLYSHQVGFGLMADYYGHFSSAAYSGDLSQNSVTIAEVLRGAGYRTAMTGKWHLTPPELESKHNWPMQRGFERFFGTITGHCDYFDPFTLVDGNEPARAGDGFYYTDAIGDHATQYIDEFATGNGANPFFIYTAFTCPHWPLQAREADIAKYADRYKGGWDAIRAERHRRQIESGLLSDKWALSERDLRVPPWQLAAHKDWEARRMAVYAAQIECMDRNIGKIVAKLKEKGVYENTLILFMSDNGGNLEEIADPGPLVQAVSLQPHATRDGHMVHPGNLPDIMPGGEGTFQSIGIPWGNVANTPFKMYKHYTQEGGISTPFIAHWPAGIKLQNGAITHQVAHETDIMATLADLAGAAYPASREGHAVPPTVGSTLAPVFADKPRKERTFFWEHEGNSAVRMGKWKLVSAYPDYWQLYDMDEDRTEFHDLASQYPDRVREMAAAYKEWAQKVGVLPWPLPGITPDAPNVMPYLRRDAQLE